MALTKVTQSMVVGKTACIFDFMTQAQIDGVQAGTYAPDLSSVFNTALATNPGSLYIPNGVYQINSTITIPYQVKLFGNGFRFRSLTEGAFITGNGAFILLDVAARDCVIEGLAFKSNGTGANANTALIYPTIANVGDTATYNLRIRDCFFVGGVSQINGAFNPGDLVVDNCQFDATADTTNCIILVENASIGNHPTQIFLDCNRFYSTTVTSIANSSAVYLDGVDTFNFTRNIIQGTFSGGIDIRSTQGYTTNIVNVLNNQFEDLQSYCIRADTAGNFIITNNEIVGFIGGTSEYGLYFDTVGNAVVANNYIFGHNRDGIYTEDCNSVSITGNKINDIGELTTNTFYCVRIVDGTRYVVADNRFSGGDNIAEQPKACIGISGSYDNMTISGNQYNVGLLPLDIVGYGSNVRAYDRASIYAPPNAETYNSGLVNLTAYSGALAASSGTLSLTLPINTFAGSVGGFSGTLAVSNIFNNSFPNSTNAIYSVSGYGTTATFTSLNSTNGSSGGASFTLAMSANGVITMTNTSANVTIATISFSGQAGLGQ